MKVASIQKSRPITHSTMGIHHSPHTHTISIPMGIPMGFPIPTAALGAWLRSRDPYNFWHTIEHIFITTSARDFKFGA